MPALLEIRQLRGGYGKVSVLRDVSLLVGKLETVSIVGPNGSGKTTLLSMIAGVLKPEGGAIIFDDEDVTGAKPESLTRKGLSLVLQGRSVFPFMTVQENLDMGSYLSRELSVIRSRLDTVFHLFPVLAQRRNQMAGSMSGGEQKMLELGRALMIRLKLLMLDEPSLGLAPLVVAMIFQNLKEFSSSGMAVLLVEQNVAMALGISHRSYLLELGRIRIQGKSEDFMNNPEIKKYYLGAAPTRGLS